MADLDVLVAGGGPAGLATALHAARAGMHVAVAEPRASPIDKACGEGLMPAAVRALADLGIDVPGVAFRGISYCDPGTTVTADFRNGTGRGVARQVLHARLHEAVRAEGVEILPLRIAAVSQTPDAVRAGTVTARYLVGADGLHSTVRRAIGAAASSPARPRWGLRAHFAIPPWTDRVEVHWSPHSEAYVTPVGPERVGVAVLGGERLAFAAQLEAFPALRARLPSRPAGDVRGAGPLRQHVTVRVAGRVLLVGDAAGYVDALTGEGLSVALACARALVARIVAGDPPGYESDYRMLSRRYRWLTTALLAAANRPALRRHIVPTAARAPWLFRAAVAQLAR